MSGGSDDTTDSQRERTTEPNGVVMGDVLTKEHYSEDNSRQDSTDDFEDDLRIPSERQAADGAPDAVDVVSSSTTLLYRLADTLEGNSLENINSGNTTLRIEDDIALELSMMSEVNPKTSEQLSDCTSICLGDASQHPDSFCPCDTCKLCKLKRAMIDDELKREIRWHRLWTELRDHIRSVFDAALEATVVPNTTRYQCDPCRLNQLRENVIQMCKRNSQQLLLMLIVQAQEFVVELKNRIKETLRDHSLTNVAEIFLTRILDGYDAFVATAKQVTDLVKPVEERHLLKFNLTWEFFNKALYENHIWMSEPSMRSVTGSFTTQLTKSRKRHSYQTLFERYVAFVEEMMRVAELWPETERLIVKWNDKQTAERGGAPDVALDSMNVSSSSDIVPKSSDKCEGPNENDVDDLDGRNQDCEKLPWNSNSVSPVRLSNGFTVNGSTETNGLDALSCLPPFLGVDKSLARNDFNEERKGFLKKRASTGDIVNPLHALDMVLRHKTDIVQEIAEEISESTDREPQRQMCQCINEHMMEIDETGKTWWTDSPCLCVLNLRWLCGVSKACPCLAAGSTKKAIVNDRPESPTSTTPALLVQKQTRHSTTQTTNPVPAAVSTATATPTTPTSTTHNHNHGVSHQGTTHTHFHGPPPDLVNSTGSNHRAHSHTNHTPHACHKQAKVEHIKRVLCNDLTTGDGDCSDSGSSQEDSCSTSSSSPRDSSRHCDCCYCEVFGPGVPSVAPVSRNYNEMRERLRQLLTKKKAKKCKAPCSPPASPVESSAPSSTSADNKPTVSTRSAAPRSNTPVPVTSTVQSEQRDQRDLEALLEFIEGNQGTKKDNKRIEKKARQKQRKLEEMLKKVKEEAEKQKLIELQKKTPEVTITVVDPQKPVSQRLLPQRNLPEVSILPAMAPTVPSLGVNKQSNTSKKKDKQQQHQQNASDRFGVTHVGKTKTAMISVTPINLNVFDFVVRESEITKRNTKSENDKSNKTAISKNIKTQSTPSPDLGDSILTDVKLTKKERKKLRREMKKLEEAKTKEPEQRVPPQSENQPQIVTIKRVMESNSAEPTVTITLKGQTPAEDKVLFTLVNGQTKEPTSAKSEQQQDQVTTGKKKKGKGSNGNNSNHMQQQQPSKGQQLQSASSKSQLSQKTNDTKVGKMQQQQQTTTNEKSKSKKTDEKKVQQQLTASEHKSTKSKKDKKNGESKQSVMQQTNTAKSKNAQHQQPQQQQQQQQDQQQQSTSKKQNKINALQQTQGNQKSQQNQNVGNETSGKKSKGQQQQPQQPQQDKNHSANSIKTNKNADKNTNKQMAKGDNQKNRTKNNQTSVKQQRAKNDPKNEATECNGSPLNSQLKDVSSSSKINIENLKLPPGITITKVDVPAKPLPIRSASIPKQATASKQTTIIAAPMSGVQSSYPGAQSGGNVIVVDTGKLKQDLLPKSSETRKEVSKDSQSGQSIISGKKKKKGKNASHSGNASNTANGSNRSGNDSGKENGDEPARILHNPGSNMVTIRNPAFGPPPKIEAAPQAAIIKVSENGMVTIRSPALQQAINAGLTPPPKPDFIVKGDPSMANTISGSAPSVTAASRTALTSTTNTSSHKNTNGIIPSTLAELRSRLTPADCNALPGLANIHISKVTNGQPIPESGINLKGTSVTLTKVRSPGIVPSNNIVTNPTTTATTTSTTIGTSMEDVQQAKSAVREAISATMNVPASGKGKKKKKRGNGTRHCGDDWNLVESVFTPKDIDLEDGEMDDAERELEAFKRFCLQSVPPPRKEKVNLNIKDIVLKKKSSSASSSSSATGAAIAAN